MAELLKGRAAVATGLFVVANFCGFLLVFGLKHVVGAVACALGPRPTAPRPDASSVPAAPAGTAS